MLAVKLDDNGDVVHGYSAHEFENGKCVHCGEYNTQGVVYGYDEGNDCYYVEDNRKLNVSEITVLSLYNDGEHGEKAVKYMRHEAFAENPFITKIILPDSVDDLDGSVFRGCENLVYVSMTGVKTWNYKETVRPYGNRDGNNNFLNCTKLQFVIISDALSTNVQQFFSTGTVETPILDFYVNGASGAPNFAEGTNQNLWTGTVYFKGDASKCLQWNFDSDGNISHGNAKHNFVDGKCSGCGIYNTQGVKYGYDATNKVYYVDKQETAFNVAKVNILPLYDDGTNGEHNVTFVRIGAFSGNADIKKVILPASITRLDGSVFADCINLEYVSMIGVTNLESKAISGGIYGDESDYTTNNFLDCEKLTTVIVNKSFTAGVQQFKSRSDSSSVCVNIYAVGSAEEVSVNISNEQNQLYGGTVYYYSETEAAGCWHYVDGVATLWA